MVGRNRFGTVGPLVLLASAATVLNAPSSHSADLTISDARTTAADTTTGDGTGPGSIIVQSGGSVTVAGAAAVTVNSSNSFTNSGTVSNTQESNATGALVQTTQNGVAKNIIGSISNQGGINVLGPVTGSSLLTTDVFNAGIKVSGLGTLTGDVVNASISGGTASAPTVTSGAILVGGNRSVGMLLQSNLVGNLANNGSIVVTGDNTYGIATTGRITGNFTQGGVLSTGGTGAVGVYLGGGINGTALFSGSITAGTGSVVTSTNGVTLTTLDPTPAKAGIWIAGDITQGISILGNRLTRAEEAKDTTAAAAATPPDSTTAVVGSTGMIIGQGGLNTTPSNITISPSDSIGGFSFKNQGNILVDGTTKGLVTTGIDIHGLLSGGTIYTTRLTGGIWNDKGNIEAAAQDAQVTGLSIGSYAVVSRFQNDGDFLISTVDSTTNALTSKAGTKGGDAYGLVIDALGVLPNFGNSGNFVVSAQGGSTSAYGIIDKSGTLVNIVNSGLINTVVQSGSIGTMTAIDLSVNTIGATINNTGTIVGSVYLGSGNSTVVLTGTDASVAGNITFQNGATKTGNSTFTMNGGLVTGLTSLGNGTHTVTLTNGAKATGGIAQGTGTLTLKVDASQLTILSSRPINASSASFTGASVLTFDINNSATALPGGILQSAGTVTFGAGAKITAALTGLIEGTKTVTAIRANSLVFGAPLSQIASSPNSYINSTTFSLDTTNPNTLLLTVRRKTATELALGQNRTAIYSGFTTAMNQDVPLVTAISALQTQGDFEASLSKLLPDSSGALQQAALNNQEMASGAIRRRLVGVAKNGMPDHAAGDIPSFWAQAIGDYSDQRARGEQNGFDIWGLGVAFGADAPAFDGTTNIGLGFTETWHSANLKTAAKSPIEFYNSQANLYARYTGDLLYLQAIAGGGYNSYNQQRHVDIGSVSRLTVGKWKGYEYGGSLETGFFTKFSQYQFTPYLRASYLRNHENAYTEVGGGTGVDLTVAARNPENARASAGFTLDRDFPVFYDSYVEAEFRANYTREFMADPYAVKSQFAVGPSFTTFSNARYPNRANVGFGIAHKDSYSSVSVDYDAELSKGYMAHKAAITARFRF